MHKKTCNFCMYGEGGVCVGPCRMGAQDQSQQCLFEFVRAQIWSEISACARVREIVAAWTKRRGGRTCAKVHLK